jgi:hypothetical protein
MSSILFVSVIFIGIVSNDQIIGNGLALVLCLIFNIAQGFNLGERIICSEFLFTLFPRLKPRAMFLAMLLNNFSILVRGLNIGMYCLSDAFVPYLLILQQLKPLAMAVVL